MSSRFKIKWNELHKSLSKVEKFCYVLDRNTELLSITYKYTNTVQCGIEVENAMRGYYVEIFIPYNSVMNKSYVTVRHEVQVNIWRSVVA